MDNTGFPFHGNEFIVLLENVIGAAAQVVAVGGEDLAVGLRVGVEDAAGQRIAHLPLRLMSHEPSDEEQDEG
jgi:hypothetical protein